MSNWQLDEPKIPEEKSVHELDSIRLSDATIRPVTIENGDSSIDRESQYQMYSIDDADINKKSGNYVLTFGRVTSGKSTLQQHVVTWLSEKSDLQTKLNPVDGYFEPVAFLQNFINRLRSGELPVRSPEDVQTEFSVSVIPNNKKLPVLDFGFFEISGEDFKSVVPLVEKGFIPSLPIAINKFLGNKNIKYSFILVSDAELYIRNNNQQKYIEPREDILFCRFLDYLGENFGNTFSTTPILFVIAKWDAVENTYTDGDKYMEANLRQTYNRLKSLKNKKIMVDLVKHSIGQVEVVGGKARVKKSNFDSTRNIAEWIYRSFTGKDINGEQKNIFMSNILRWL
jgi:energy-coupling factor transporter ATP-binding protein EcfA2